MAIIISHNVETFVVPENVETSNVFDISDENAIKNSIHDNIVIFDEDIDVAKKMANIIQHKNKVICISDEIISIDKNVIHIGINIESLVDILENDLIAMNVEYYTEKKVKQLGILKILNIIFKPNVTYHLVLNSKILTNLSAYETISICDIFRGSTNILEIVGFNDLQKSNHFARNIFSSNLITENTKFIIYRNIEQKDNSDIGWMILNNISLSEMNIMVNQIGDKIIAIDYEDSDGYEKTMIVTVTTMKEQNEKSIKFLKNVNDCCLLEESKKNMLFDLLSLTKNK
jgi:hypothetical protein